MQVHGEKLTATKLPNACLLATVDMLSVD
eukprot:SAG11_NODE_26572_length_343_cov_1.057377_1_plen_28_part_10